MAPALQADRPRALAGLVTFVGFGWPLLAYGGAPGAQGQFVVL